MGASFKSILDSASGVGVGIAYAVPEGGAAAAALIIGADALVDLFWPSTQDPSSLAVTNDDLQKAIDEIANAIFVQASDVQFLNMITLNDQISEAFQQPATTLSPFYAGDFPSDDNGAAYNDWVARMQQFIAYTNGPNPPAKMAIDFASDHPQQIFQTLALYTYTVESFFRLSAFVVTYLLNQAARNNKVLEQANDPAVVQWKQDVLTWRLNGKQGPQPTAPGFLSGSIPDIDMLILKPYVFDASEVANNAIAYLQDFLTKIDAAIATIESACSQRGTELVIVEAPPRGFRDPDTFYCYYDTTSPTGLLNTPTPFGTSPDRSVVVEERQKVLDDYRVAQIALVKGLDLSPEFRQQINDSISLYQKSQSNCLEFIKTYSSFRAAHVGGDGHGR